MILRAMVCALVLLPTLVLAESGTPPGVTTGRIVGQVRDANGNAIEDVNVRVLGLRIGIATDERGRFELAGVPIGVQHVRAQALGRTPLVRVVSVDAGAAAVVDFQFADDAGPVKTVPEVVVEGRRQIETHESGSRHGHEGDELRRIPGVDDVVRAIALAAGIVTDAEGVHIRGGRGDETKIHISGIEVSQPLSGGSVSIASLAVASGSVETGGMEAEVGGALSGVISLETREGTGRFGGEMRWDTDRYGDPTKTFDNFDRFTFGFGGPTPIKDLTYFATYEGTFQDTYLRTSQSEPRRTLWDFIQLGNRQSNQINTNFKLAYRISPKHKVTLETIHNRSIETPYEHMWSRQGFVKVTYDTVQAVGRPDAYVPRYGTWSNEREDSTFQAVNLPDHVPTDDDRFQGVTAVWTDQVSSTSVWATRLSAFEFEHLSSVGQKRPWDYAVTSPEYWDGNTTTGSENNLFFATHGDYPVYSQYRTATWAMKSDFSSARWKHHTLKTGAEARYNRVENLALQLPNGESNGLPGGIRSDFLNFNPEGSCYLQDRWDFEGLVLNAGLRYDVFTPGDQVPTSDLPSGKRFKRQLSPRLGIAYPISDRDALSFHYGWTYQNPQRNYVFENRGLTTSVGTRGNPDLEPETNVAYQAAVQHLFSKDVSGQFAVFFRDIYGLISTRADHDVFGNQFTKYVNRDYASARGFEASVIKSFSHRFSAEANYTYQIASGVASDPRQSQQFFTGGRLYLPISELPLRWDQRNTLTLQGAVREPGRWGFRFLWRYGSGRPFTPTFRNDRKADPGLENSQRLPASTTLSVDGDRYFRLWGQSMTLFVDARNILDAKTLASLSYGVFPNPFVGQSGDEYLIYFTETGRAGGAYLQDVNGDHVLDWVPLHDPRVFEEGRNVRMGMSLTF